MAHSYKGLKVLKLDGPVEKGPWKKLIIEELEKYYVEITPKINRNGRYYNRQEDIAWTEINGRAWLEDGTSMFKYELELYNHTPLTEKQVKAVNCILYSTYSSKKLRRLLYIDTCWKETRRVFRSARLHRLNFDKKLEQFSYEKNIAS